jgi:hypothetical protein
MINNRSETMRPGLYMRMSSLYRQDTRVRIAVQALFLTLMGALSAFLKAQSPGIGVSGSSAVLWLGPIILARMLVKRDGAGVFTGACVALWGVPLGINNGLMHNMALFGLSGAALDVICRVPFIKITTPVGAVVCGIFAHLVKFGYIYAAALGSTSVKHFILSGILRSLGQHILFGAMAGIAAWLIYRAWKADQERRSRQAIKEAV